ncbi:MAG: Hin recombinase [Actinobacteria bacterium]|nr:Hin recombinase [Actinomycetota bacterium]
MPCPPKLSPSQVAQVVTLKANGVSNAAIARRFGVHRNTIGRLFVRLRTERDPPVLQPCGLSDQPALGCM